MPAFRKGALEALAAACATQVGPEWRCAVCGCTAAEAGRRAVERGRALHKNAVTCGERECQRARERERLKQKYGPGSAYYRRLARGKRAVGARRRRRV